MKIQISPSTKDHGAPEYYFSYIVHWQENESVDLRAASLEIKLFLVQEYH